MSSIMLLTVLLRCNVTQTHIYFLLHSCVLRTTHLMSLQAHTKRIAHVKVLTYVTLITCNARMQTHYARALKDLTDVQ